MILIRLDSEPSLEHASRETHEIDLIYTSMRYGPGLAAVLIRQFMHEAIRRGGLCWRKVSHAPRPDAQSNETSASHSRELVEYGEPKHDSMVTDWGLDSNLRLLYARLFELSKSLDSKMLAACNHHHLALHTKVTCSTRSLPSSP